MRIFQAVRAFFAILFQKDTAELYSRAIEFRTEVAKLKQELEDQKLKARLEPPRKSEPDVDKTAMRESGAAALLQLLQQEARFVDFVSEDISELPDDQVGGVCRLIHTDLKKVFEKYLKVERVLDGVEGERIQVGEAIQRFEYRLSSGKDVHPPFEATLNHRGWVLKSANLPRRESPDAQKVLMPAEMEM